MFVKADLLHQWGVVVPKLAQDAHAQAIDKVWEINFLIGHQFYNISFA